MEYTFASRRQLSFIVSAGGRNMLVAFGNRNQAGVSVFLTLNDKVAQAIRRHALTRRGIIEETTKAASISVPASKPGDKPSKTAAKTVAHITEEALFPADESAGMEATGEAEERTYDNYTVARESICKEFGINKGTVRKPETLAQVAKEHGIIIKYKEL